MPTSQLASQAEEAPSSTAANEDRSVEFVRLFARHEHQIYAYIVSALGNWADADEVMQETSVALWEMFDRFEPGTSFRQWACRIAYYRILRYGERRQRDRHHFDHEFVEAVAKTAEQEAAEFDTRRTALSGCLSQLSSQDRELLKSCYLSSTSIKQVAENRGRPVKRVYKMLSRIRQILFQCVQRKLAAEESGR